MNLTVHGIHKYRKRTLGSLKLFSCVFLPSYLHLLEIVSCCLFVVVVVD